MIKPIIFLDVDGVLNGGVWFADSHRALVAKYRERVSRPNANKASNDSEFYAETHVNPASVAILNKILLATGANIVLSSTWRLSPRTSNALYLVGIDNYKERLLGFTDHKGPERGNEIQRWMDEHQFKGPFCILDDDGDMSHLTPYLVRTNWGHGLEEKDLQRVLDVLAKQDISCGNPIS